ncbi:golgi matrix protein [Xylona heveae TC161]|uniref:Golgi matrix protein n=1 Tax=Xylona heveae (strain CBS 132557 / TC161) TaxID=1328760 RepID=A0A161THJ1_XYLHT|nr:golgi matrix protein [Xylona heveae TC161]KZF25717.1 golgi matrix protein [Xylona heveae TC161]
MSAASGATPVHNPPAPVSKNKKNKKKKAAAAAAKANGDASKVIEPLGEEPETAPEKTEPPTDGAPVNGSPVVSPTANGQAKEPDNEPEEQDDGEAAVEENADSPAEAIKDAPSTTSIPQPPLDETEESKQPSDTEERLDALVKDRDSLRAEVTELRKALEDIQGKHEQEVSTVQGQLEEAQNEKEHAESQYRNLLGKVNTIRSQLGERLKADAEALAQSKSQIEELEEQNRSLAETNDSLEAQLNRLNDDQREMSNELSSLRDRSSLSQQNWLKEREDLIKREALAKEEFEAAKQAMQDWEVLAMEERSIRENLSDRVSDLEDQLSNQRAAYERAASERDSQSLTVDGLQRALQEMQDARKTELRELVENSQAQMDELRKQVQEAEKRAGKAEETLDSTKKELERALPFEKEVKEKNLLIGKLRHEAVILNDHLTKALRFLKRGRPEDNVDRQIVTNHFLRFLALDRADPKKFQVLQLIAALLDWTDEQREQAGLARPGTSNSNLRAPLSPFHRTPSTPTVLTELPSESGNHKESLAELWSSFLEQEAHEGAKSSRRGSAVSNTSKPS